MPISSSLTAQPSVPYADTDPAAYNSFMSNYHAFKISGDVATVGYIRNDIVARFVFAAPNWHVDAASKTVTLLTLPDDARDPFEARSAHIAATLQDTAARRTFGVLAGWRNELYPIYGTGGRLLAGIERAAASLFGLVTFGVHLTAFTRRETDGELLIWVPRRARTKQTFPGMLDNSVAGGIAIGERPLDCVIREAMEEASLPEETVRAGLRACGVVTYAYVDDSKEKGLLQPECEYVYDLELKPDVVLKPCDSEVEEFALWNVAKVKEAMANGEFKPNCALVLVDFFLRHGIITPENEKDYLEIAERTHRRLGLPMGTSWRNE